jgi:hypothetical protein
MGDLDKNIYRKDEPSPYEKIIINPIEKDKKEKESYTGLKGATRSQIYATLVSYFKQFLSAFSKGKGQPILFNLQQLFDNIVAFRRLLVTLSAEDQSHNPNFTQKLSELWHNLLDDCNSLSLSTEASSEIVTKVKFFISQVQNFPPGADHTLGYYFSEYAGKDWIPFPFMEMLQQLHEEFTASPVISVLSNWISLLNEILGISDTNIAT